MVSHNFWVRDWTDSERVPDVSPFKIFNKLIQKNARMMKIDVGDLFHQFFLFLVEVFPWFTSGEYQVIWSSTDFVKKFSQSWHLLRLWLRSSSNQIWDSPGHRYCLLDKLTITTLIHPSAAMDKTILVASNCGTLELAVARLGHGLRRARNFVQGGESYLIFQ